jgi:hypothetical protein
MSAKIHQVTRRCQHSLTAPRHLGSDVSQCRFTGPAFDKFDLELFFELPNLHGQSRLGDRTGFGSTTEMPILRERVEITELPQGDHRS